MTAFPCFAKCRRWVGEGLANLIMGGVGVVRPISRYMCAGMHQGRREDVEEMR